ncbi:hypothetical protein [Nocardioides sp. L-11A]|uniref:zinc finger domain-containing protein n=1 Tax=Nocardioides sp. L-11A TaxID=3043848 RepID=UPI00249CCB15|nr:hypothetical protein QJ852_10035 [Nocardioides sp. L-11A]
MSSASSRSAAETNWDRACPHCKAEAGEPCRRPNGDKFTRSSGAPRFHAARARPVAPKPLSPAEYGRMLARKSKPLTEEQIERAARILATVEVPAARLRPGSAPDAA